MKHFIKIITVLAIALTLTACAKTHQLYNANTIIPTAQRTTLENTGKQIEKALQYKRWEIKSHKPGVIEADIHVRRHSAAIKIEYSEKRFAINYVDSVNLKYNQARGKIHRNYNRWINMLESEILYYLKNTNTESHQPH